MTPAAPTLLVGTTNPFKVARWRRVLSGAATVITPGDLGLSLPIGEGSESTGDNAKAKARAWSAAANLPALADDLGLFIHARGGFPGAAMKTWAGAIPESAADAERMILLQYAVRDLSDTTCYLETAIAVAVPDGHVALRVHRDHGWIDKRRTSEPHSGALLEWAFIFGAYRRAWREMDSVQQAAIDRALRVHVTDLLARIRKSFPKLL